ncbi:Protein srek1IP1 [Blastocladiella emersonii ATCC 22665]|nr:Protein srek1IP1 [Blastocladiella emersonii ATCC 22665]
MPAWILVSNVSRHVQKDKLRKLFAHLGDIRQLVLKPADDGSPTTEAAIEFAKSDDARVAVLLDGTPFLDTALAVAAYQDEDQLQRIARTLRIDRVPLDANVDTLKALFAEAAVDGIRRMRMGNGTDPDTALGYAFVEFGNPEQKEAAVARMEGAALGEQQLIISNSRIAISKGKSGGRPPLVLAMAAALSSSAPPTAPGSVDGGSGTPMRGDSRSRGPGAAGETRSRRYDDMDVDRYRDRDRDDDRGRYDDHRRGGGYRNSARNHSRERSPDAKRARR